MASPPEIVRRNPNATTATGLGGVGVFLVWLLGYLHVSLTAEDGTVISGAITSLGLLIGKRGICGLGRLIWRGEGGAASDGTLVFVIAFVLGVLVDKLFLR